MTKGLLIDADSFGMKKLESEVYDAIVDGGLQVISSRDTELERELRDADRALFSQLKKAAKICDVCSSSVSKKIQQMTILRSDKKILSNDVAVLAGAIVSRTNTLITKDGNLKKDFKACGSIDQKTQCRHRIDLPSNSSRKVITPPHASSPGKPPRGTPKKKVRELLEQVCCSPINCNCLNGGPTC